MLSLAFVVLRLLPVSSQISFGGHPSGLSAQLALPAPLAIPAPDLDAVRAEDRKNPEYNRFAVPVLVDVGIDQFEWKNSDQRRIGIVALRCQGAEAIAIQFSAFRLARGAEVFVYSRDGKQILGAYTHDNNREGKPFLLGFVEGNEVVLEINEPASEIGEGSELHISRLLYAYKSPRASSGHPFQVYQGRGFGDALPCHINVNCPEAIDWQEEKSGIVRILRVFEEGAGWCTGSLINTTADDGRPLVLSAFHCQQGLTPIYDLWRFDFSYEFSGCDQDTAEPPFGALLGAQPLAMRQETDFLLFELESPVPLLFQAQFNGWNRDDTHVPEQSAILHHPFGDVKKYSADHDPAIIFPSPINWSNNVITPANHHFRVILDEGTIESGSSGAPLFDEEGRIVGQLHGGNASCDQFLTYHGRLALSWEEGSVPETRLREWLDPVGTGAQEWPAWQTPSTVDSLIGRVEDLNGGPIALATVVLEGPGQTDSLVTDHTGQFVFTGVPVGEGFTIKVLKDLNPRNGVSTFDLLKIQQHILKIAPFQYVWEYFASDVTTDGAISISDLLQLQRVILQLVQQMPGTTSWQFFPQTVLVDLLPANSPEVRITGIKTGDLTGDADPLK